MVRIGAYYQSLPGPAVSRWWNDLDDDEVPYSTRTDSNALNTEFERFIAGVLGDTTAEERAAATITFFWAPPGNVVYSDTDYRYRRGSTAPALPTGGTTDDDHTPTGWSRTELQPTTTQDVYRVERTRSYTNGRFSSATAWASVTKVADRTAPGAIGVASNTFGVGVEVEVLPPSTGPTPTVYRVQIRRQNFRWDDAQYAFERSRTTAGKVQFNVSASNSWQVRARAETADGNGPWITHPFLNQPGDRLGFYSVNVPINRVGRDYGVAGSFVAGALQRMPDELIEGSDAGFLRAIALYTSIDGTRATFDLDVAPDVNAATSGVRSLVSDWESRAQATRIAFAGGNPINLPGPANSRWTSTDSADPYFADVDSNDADSSQAAFLRSIVAWRNRNGPTRTREQLGGAAMIITFLWSR